MHWGMELTIDHLLKVNFFKGRRWYASNSYLNLDSYVLASRNLHIPLSLINLKIKVNMCELQF